MFSSAAASTPFLPASSGPDSILYRGRFAPSPTGPLHAGSLVAALASRLDALAHGGRWLVRIEDLDTARVVPGSADAMLLTLERFGFSWDEPVVWQSRRTALYEAALERLRSGGLTYPCACSRKEIADSLGSAEPGSVRVYPGTCRNGVPSGRLARAWRLRTRDGLIEFDDRRLGRHSHDLARATGDFILKRADGAWAYQLAVVVDDAAQGITDVVRGADLIDSTPRQILLQHLLGYPCPRTLHVPVLHNALGEKLSKSQSALALDTNDALAQLHAAAFHLGLGAVDAASIDDFWKQATTLWRDRWGMAQARLSGPEQPS